MSRRPREGHRRRFSEADKTRILEEAAQPGASAAEVARRYGIARARSASMEAGAGGTPVFVAVQITDADAPAVAPRREELRMTLLPPSVKVHLALGYIDMRKGIDGLAMLVQGVLQQDPFSGHLFVFRGRTGPTSSRSSIWDGTGLCLFTKRLEHGVFLWPPSVEPGGDAVADLGAVVAADRRRRLARAGAAVAAGRCGLSDATGHLPLRLIDSRRMTAWAIGASRR